MLLQQKGRSSVSRKAEGKLRQKLNNEKADPLHRSTANRQAGSDSQPTLIEQSVESELTRYFALLDGEPPKDLHRMVMSQVEKSLLVFVLDQCGNNQSRAAEYLGISRGTLRSRINEQDL